MSIRIKTLTVANLRYFAGTPTWWKKRRFLFPRACNQLPWITIQCMTVESFLRITNNRQLQPSLSLYQGQKLWQTLLLCPLLFSLEQKEKFWTYNLCFSFFGSGLKHKTLCLRPIVLCFYNCTPFETST